MFLGASLCCKFTRRRLLDWTRIPTVLSPSIPAELSIFWRICVVTRNSIISSYVVRRTERKEPMSPKTAAQMLAITALGEDAFYISATKSASRSRRTLKHNDTFVVLDSHGDIGASPGNTEGLFCRDTRYLSRLELLVNDAPPLELGSNLRDDNASLAVDLTNPDFFSDQQVVLEKDTVHILRTIFLWRDTAYQRLSVRNYGNRTVDVRLSILFANDFADLFEVRGNSSRASRHRDGPAARRRPGPPEISRTRR